jgi:hypothetical protein
MLALKQKKILLYLLLSVLSIEYFMTFSIWEINPIIKNYLALIPLQILALLYVGHFYWHHRRN